jgi:hypothetical protein
MKKAKANKSKDKEVANGVDAGKQASTYTSKTTFDQVWGKNWSKFKPADPEKYSERLQKLTKFDLQQECIVVGLVPHDERNVMVHRLEKECLKNHNANLATSIRPKQIVIKSAAAQSILNKAAAF